MSQDDHNNPTNAGDTTSTSDTRDMQFSQTDKSSGKQSDVTSQQPSVADKSTASTTSVRKTTRAAATHSKFSKVDTQADIVAKKSSQQNTVVATHTNTQKTATEKAPRGRRRSRTTDVASVHNTHIQEHRPAHNVKTSERVTAAKLSKGTNKLKKGGISNQIDSHIDQQQAIPFNATPSKTTFSNQFANKGVVATFWVKLFGKHSVQGSDAVTNQSLSHDEVFGVKNAHSRLGKKNHGAISTQRNNQMGGQQLFAELANEMLTEQRRKRRWSVVFRAIGWLVVIFVLYQIFIADSWRDNINFTGGQVFQSTSEAQVGVVEIKGIIAEDGDTNAYSVIANLNAAVTDEKTIGVILDINSPGGTPVQAATIYREVRRLREAYPHIPIHAVITDIGTSGAYYVAAAAEKIFADPTSLVGSVGVIQAGFGFDQVMEKLGVERRIITSGEQKSQLDPYLPQNPQQVAYWQEVLDRVHQQFIADVVQTRPQLADKHGLLNGQIFDGIRAIEQGLVDATGDVLFVARQEWENENLVFFEDETQKILALLEKLGVNTLLTLFSKSTSSMHSAYALPQISK